MTPASLPVRRARWLGLLALAAACSQGTTTPTGQVDFAVERPAETPPWLVAVHRDTPASPPSTRAPAWAGTGAVWLMP